jgi:hypothetical protein
MIACGIWETITGVKFQEYLPWDSLVPTDPLSGATVIALLVFFSYAIVLNTVVPISLYVRYRNVFLMGVISVKRTNIGKELVRLEEEG